MSRVVGLVLLLVASLVLGTLLGEMNFRFYQKVLPPAAMGQVSLGWVHTTCLFYGLALGAVLFVWGVMAAALAPAFRGRRKAA